MTAVSPVVPGSNYAEIVIAEDQKPYKPLPCCRVGDYILSRWHMTLKERLTALLTGDIYLWVRKPLYGPLQPLKLQVEKPA